MALVSYFHEGLDRFISFAEESEAHLVRSGWVRKDNPADTVADDAATVVEVASEPVTPPPPVGEDIVYGDPVQKPEHEAPPEVPVEQQ